MKISASLYSNKNNNIIDTVKELDAYKIDCYHIDCNDDLNVFSDIETINKISDTPIDLHIISDNPEKFYSHIINNNIRYITFQYENLNKKLEIPKEVQSKVGIAITSSTDINIFEEYKDICSHILFMTTIPGVSGGEFNKDTFKKIRQFRQKYPDKKIHVDGGINEELSFIMRNMGIYLVVTGSFLFKQNYIGSALLQMKSNDIKSKYLVKDFMLQYDEIPVISEQNYTFYDVLKSIDDFRMGFTIIADSDKKVKGIISSADIRRLLIKNINDLNAIDVNEMINKNPAYAYEEDSVSILLEKIKNLNFPVLFMPVINENKQITGTIKFNNLVKGE